MVTFVKLVDGVPITYLLAMMLYGALLPDHPSTVVNILEYPDGIEGKSLIRSYHPFDVVVKLRTISLYFNSPAKDDFNEVIINKSL